VFHPVPILSHIARGGAIPHPRLACRGEFYARDRVCFTKCAQAQPAHTHSKKQIGQIAKSIDAFGFTQPVIIDETSTLLAGHGRFEAAKLRGLKKIPAIRLRGLSEAKKRALLLADNKVAENAGWDRKRLAIGLPELTDLLIVENLDISVTGFEPVEIDTLASDFEEAAADPADDLQANWLSLAPVSQPGDVWQLGPHRLLCGDACEPADLDRLLGDKQAAMAFLDPPYNVKIASVVGRGRTIELGRHGRSRSNVWNYAGVNSFRAGRMDELRAHPTVKPVALVADAMKDCTRRNDIVLDTFCGSGTTVLAAERVGRQAYCLELEPRYVDVAVRRWQAFTRRDAIHGDAGCTFDERALELLAAAELTKP
jgi:16S rRNA G966 N2-methylase RsmD